MKKYFISLSFFLILQSVFGQSLTVFDIDPSSFPTIKANFIAFDSQDSLILNLSSSDFQVTENGVERTVSVSCPVSKPPQVISIAMSIDVSSSMSLSDFGEIPADLGKTTAIEICNLLEMPPSEFALQTCDDHAYINQDFTTDKSKILSAISSITQGYNNDFVEQLLNPITGILNIAKMGKYKRIAVLYTDAYWFALSESQLQQCKDTCIKYNIQFYAVIYSRSEAQPNGIKSSLNELASATGGIMYDGILSSNAAKYLGIRLQQITQGGDPCTIKWQSSFQCDTTQVSSIINLLTNNSKDTVTYTTPSSAITSLKVTPSGVYFKNTPPGTKKDTTITIKAINSAFSITNIISSDTLFSVTPTSFNINAGDSRTLTISYTPTDSSNNFTTFNLITNQCPASFFAGGYFVTKKVKKQTIKITQPNGGEVFFAGCDTVITWTGVLPSDTVKLEYSIDSGKTWKKLTSAASGLSWKWKDVPLPVSNKCLVRVSSNSAPPPIEWQKCFGGSNDDEAQSIQENIDGTFIVAGYTYSNDGNVTGNHGSTDYWIVKLSKTGSLIWQKCLGGTGVDVATSIQNTYDGGYIVAGYTYSSNGNVTGKHGTSTYDDYWIVKLTSAGVIEWQKCLGGTDDDEAWSVQETDDGSYVIAGFTNSSDGDVTGNNGGYDYWTVKLSDAGAIIWQKCLGGTDQDWATSIQETRDSGYIVAGFTNSYNGDITGKHGTSSNDVYWIVKLSKSGTIQWQKCLGGNSNDIAWSIQELSDSGYIVTGYSNSIDGDVSGNQGGNDYWIVKLSNAGTIVWQKSIGGSNDDESYSVQETFDGGYIVAGNTLSNDGDVAGNLGGSDYWIVKLSSAGDIEWQRCLGGSDDDVANAIQQTSDGGYVVAGYTTSNDGDVSGNHGGEDFWIVKLAPDADYQQAVSDSLFAIVSPKATSKDIDMKQCLVGKVKDSIITSFLINTGIYQCRIDSIYFTGADASAFSITSDIPPFEIAVGSSKSVEFQFTPSRIGIHNAKVVVITQSDTLITNIRGQGIAPQLAVIATTIDFGSVRLGYVKDTTITAVIKNVGTTAVSITGIKFLGPNTTDFRLTSGTADTSFVLTTNSSAKMKLRFKPSDIGRTSGRLDFYFTGQISPLEVQLFGIGFYKIAVIQASKPVQNFLLCDSKIADTILLTNTGSDILTISSVKITGNDTNDFSIDSIIKNIMPDSSINLIYNFIPTTAGIKTVGLKIISNADPDSILIISIKEIKDSITFNVNKIESDTIDIDMGTVCPGGKIDSIITIFNKSTKGTTINIDKPDAAFQIIGTDKAETGKGDKPEAVKPVKKKEKKTP